MQIRRRNLRQTSKRRLRSFSGIEIKLRLGFNPVKSRIRRYFILIVD
jgi:hypothetical protein